MSPLEILWYYITIVVFILAELLKEIELIEGRTQEKMVSHKLLDMVMVCCLELHNMWG